MMTSIPDTAFEESSSFSWKQMQSFDISSLFGNVVHHFFGCAFRRQGLKTVTDIVQIPEGSKLSQNKNLCAESQSLRPKSNLCNAFQSLSSDQSEDDGVDRRNEEAIKAIESSALKALLLQQLDPENKLNPEECSLERRVEGSFNHCAIFDVGKLGRFVLKIPFTGTKAVWQEGDAYNLRNEARTMNYIRRHTKVPVPEVLAWDDTLENVISAPYILMRAVEGIPAFGLWVATNCDGTPDYMNIDQPSSNTHELRCNFLRSLASTVAELRHLEFDGIGMLNFDNDPDAPTVASWYTPRHDGSLEEIPAYSSSQALFRAKLAKFLSLFTIPAEDNINEGLSEDDLDYIHPEYDMGNFNCGVYNFFQYTFRAFPASTSGAVGDEKETFVLRHTDLDMQNIYVDERGNIVGIIDWDLVMTAPRCVGYSSLPVFLREDWASHYNPTTAEHMPWTIQRYARIYSQYMIEALSASSPDSDPGDGKYTLKSAMYTAAWEFGTHRDAASVFINRMFKEIPSLRGFDPEAFLEKFGSDERIVSADNELINSLKEIFRPGDIAQS